MKESNMSVDHQEVGLVFVGGFTDRDAREAHDRGYRSHVIVELSDQTRYAVTFYNPGRLRQDLEESTTHGRSFVADPGMIIVPEVTLAAMETAAKELAQEGFFGYFQPISKERLAQADPFQWPP